MFLCKQRAGLKGSNDAFNVTLSDEDDDSLCSTPEDDGDDNDDGGLCFGDTSSFSMWTSQVRYRCQLDFLFVCADYRDVFCSFHRRENVNMSNPHLADHNNTR